LNGWLAFAGDGRAGARWRNARPFPKSKTKKTKKKCLAVSDCEQTHHAMVLKKNLCTSKCFHNIVSKLSIFFFHQANTATVSDDDEMGSFFSDYDDEEDTSYSIPCKKPHWTAPVFAGS
jgi:hypothetical protein